MQCYTSIADRCEWKRNGYPLDNFDKLKSDEWQICSKQPGDEDKRKLVDPDSESGKEAIESHICATRYPGNVRVRLEPPGAVSMEDSPFEQYKTKTTVRPTNFFLSEEDLVAFNLTCPIERKLTGSESCSGSYNNAVWASFPPFDYLVCQCPAMIKKTEDFDQGSFEWDYNVSYLEANDQENQTAKMDFASGSPCFMKFKTADDLQRWNMTYSRRIMLKVRFVEQYVDSCDEE